MDEKKRNSLISSVLAVQDWFSFDLTVKIFGVVVFEYHFPPRKS